MSDFSNLAKDYIEEAQVEAKLRFGRELSPAEIAGDFAQHNFDARINHLKTLKTDGALDLREAAKRLTYERALLDTHHRLRKIDR